jgi:hypothetical protein
VFCVGRGVRPGVGVDAQNPGGGGGVDSVRPSIGVNSSETEGVGEVMCANAPGKSEGFSKH